MTLEAAKGSPLSNKKETKKWSAAAVMLNTTAKVKRLEFCLPELNANRNIEKSCHVADIELKNNHMIVGRDLITSLQLDIKGSDMSIKWDDSAIPWRSVVSTVNDILDAKHKKADLNKIASSADHLTNSEQSSLLALLKKYQDLFHGAFGTFTSKP
jgi:hypothetical protein